VANLLLSVIGHRDHLTPVNCGKTFSLVGGYQAAVLGAAKTFTDAQIVHHCAQRVVPKWSQIWVPDADCRVLVAVDEPRAWPTRRRCKARETGTTGASSAL